MKWPIGLKTGAFISQTNNAFPPPVSDFSPISKIFPSQLKTFTRLTFVKKFLFHPLKFLMTFFSH